MTKAASELPDVHARADTRGVALAEVGVRGLVTRLQIDDGVVSHGPALVKLSLSVPLRADSRAAHLSRFGEAISAWGETLALRDLWAASHDIATRLGASAARIEGRFSILVERRAPVSHTPGLLELEAGFTASWAQGNAELRQRLTAPVQSLCPCSKEMAEKGAHNQRCQVTVDAASAEGLPYLALLEAIEAAASCPVFPVLKREDEKWVTERAYARPAFVEDIARDLTAALARLPALKAVRIEVQSQESIHPHDAYAISELA